MNEDDKRKDSSNDEEEAAEQPEAQPAEAAEQAEQGEPDEPDTETALAEAEARAEENWNQFLRARAEMENLRRRAEKDVAQARQQSLEKLAGELLAVKDSLEMGVQTARSEGADITQIAEGSELTLRMFNQALEKFRIEEINPEGERFDPACHEAMAAQPAADAEPNTVLNVVQKGYRLGERLLRPAMVIVAKAPEENGGEG